MLVVGFVDGGTMRAAVWHFEGAETRMPVKCGSITAAIQYRIPLLSPPVVDVRYPPCLPVLGARSVVVAMAILVFGADAGARSMPMRMVCTANAA